MSNERGLVEVKLVKRDSQGELVHGQFESIGQTNLFPWLAERCEGIVSRGQRGAARAAAIANFYGEDVNDIAYGK